MLAWAAGKDATEFIASTPGKRHESVRPILAPIDFHSVRGMSEMATSVRWNGIRRIELRARCGTCPVAVALVVRDYWKYIPNTKIY